jgi:hypothetical protein
LELGFSVSNLTLCRTAAAPREGRVATKQTVCNQPQEFGSPLDLTSHDVIGSF